MTDWTKTTGVNGTMMIRDTGSDVEFWFRAGHPAEWVNGLDFSYTANGSTTPRTINYPTGADWFKIGERNVSTDQTVIFRLLSDTSIDGIGGPTTFSHAINRATNPSAPSRPVITAIRATAMTVSFSDGSNGGDAIDSRQIAYSTLSSTPGSSTSYPVVSSDGSTNITGLSEGTRYYFWARTHNSEGYSSWSPSASAVTLDVPDAPSTPLLSSVQSTTVDVAFTPNGSGGATITGYQIGYGTTTAIPPTTIVSAASPHIVGGLTPGTVYYFRARARNSIGWGSWSGAASARTIAGAYIQDGSTVKLAVPYVRDGGVWKMAEPWVRNLGVWKRTV
jgi:hypothetical protein